MEKQMHALTEFIDRLIEEKRFAVTDPDVLRQIRLDLTERVEDRINATVLENIPTEKLEEFNAFLDRASAEQIQEYCRENIPNLDESIAEALVCFRDTYLNA